jgi:hypothetical protein
MLLNLVWERASDSKTFERKPRAVERCAMDASIQNRPKKERRMGFLEGLEKMLSAHADLILKDLRD